MRRFPAAFTLVSIFAFSTLLGAESPLLRAMADELARTMKKLKLSGEMPPYYVAYRVDDEETFTITARFGAIVGESSRRERRLYVDLRIGDYEFDNSNFVPMTDGYRLTLGSQEQFIKLPLDDDYDAIRQKLWLATDERYKEALDLISRKRAVLAHKEEKEKIADFSRATTWVTVAEPQRLYLDRDLWRENIRQVSNLFRQYPKIQTSEVVLSVKSLTRYFIDSDGNRQVTNCPLTYIEVYAHTQDKDGARLKDFIGFYGRTPEDLPVLSTVIERVKGMAETLSIYIDVKKGDEYSGPVMFLGTAAGQFFYQLLGKGVSDVRKPLYESEGVAEKFEEKTGFLYDRLNRPVLPEGFSVVDDPGITEFAGTPLIGGYTIDDEGVKAERVEVIRKGRLVGLPMSRKPTKEFKSSNGHGRFFQGRNRSFISNLIVESEAGVTALEEELLALCKKKGLDYGIVVTQLATGLPKTDEEMLEEFYALFAGAGEERPLLDAPLFAYKLYTDGRKELIKGLKFEGVTLRVLEEEIAATGKEAGVYNALIKGRFGDSYLPVSIVAPGIIVERMRLAKKEEAAKKPPFLPHPYFHRR